MHKLIGIVIALTLTLAVVPVLVQAQLVIGESVFTSSAQRTAIVTPSASTKPSSASTYAPGHGATPPGQGGTPPGQAKKAGPDLDEDDEDLDPTGTGVVRLRQPARGQ